MLASGTLAGKIICPNEKCKAKIGSFDWAGVQCGCKEWVVPVSIFLLSSGLKLIFGSLRGSAFIEARWMKSGSPGWI